MTVVEINFDLNSESKYYISIEFCWLLYTFSRQSILNKY